ncbi:MAG: hypothetical protein DHS20C10_10730 [marine bacterium B5-7]|nr:MAG: hypothetical protein DHS20C10_10730 [marine bacterium B5-7]
MMKWEYKPGDWQQEESATCVAEPQCKMPRRFIVYLLNDDFTPMHFVVDALEKFFNKNHEQAVAIMLNVHNTGKGKCGVYPHGLAETKIAQVHQYAAEYQYPLKCRLEQAPDEN